MLHKVKEMLEAEGIHVMHLLIAYDAAEEGDKPAYHLGTHTWPQVEDHPQCHTFLAASALRAVGPEMEHGATGYMTSYFPDGAVLVVPTTLGNFRHVEDEDDGND